MIVEVNSDVRYIVTVNKDNYYIKNNTFTNLEITLKELSCDNPSRNIKTFTLSSGETLNLNINYITGNIGIFVGSEDVYNVYIVNYQQVLSSIIDLVERIICGCNCSNCDDCNGDEHIESKRFLQLFSLILSYYIVRNPIYDKYFKIIADKLKCDIQQDLICQINNLILVGDSDNIFFLKRLVSYFYLVFYIQESFQTTNQEDAEYVREKYNYSKIKPCIKKLGINPDNIIKEVLSGMEVKYWQFTNTVSDINTVISAWTPTYLDTLPGIDSRPLEDFEQGVIIPYTNIGRIGFAISPTQLINFTIVDSLGNDVTDDFDTHYFSDDETVVFVSKVPYSHSNIYFKFKKNVYA